MKNILIVLLFFFISNILLAQNASISDDPVEYSAGQSFAQGFSVIIPPFNKEKLGYGSGFGGSLIYENYMINALWGGRDTLAGVVTGGMLSVLAYLSKEDSASLEYRNSTLINGGLYGGYQFLIPLPRRLAIIPLFYTGVKYFLSIHFNEGNLFVVPNPLFIAGMEAKFLVSDKIFLFFRTEYELYYEGRDITTGIMREPAHTLLFSIGLGDLF